MQDVPKALLDCLSGASNVRILAISDGAIWDTDGTLQQADIVADQMKRASYSMSVTAVRLFTSNSQPDTRALASVLQYNTTSPGSIIDIRADPSDVLGFAKAIGETTEFTTSCGPSLVLTAGNGCLQEAPWADPASSLRLGSVQPDTPMSFWLNAPPEGLALN